MVLDYKDVNDLNRYKLMSDTVVPRPIAWIVTEDDGVLNAAPFSYFVPLSSNPPVVVVSIGHKDDGSQKDSLANILKTKKATICFVNKDNAEIAKNCATPLPKEDGEVKKFCIDTTKMLSDYPPIINSTQSALFCDFYSQVDLPGKTVPLILEIKKQYIEEERLDEKFHVHVDNVGRSGVKFKEMVDF